jgi:hypothetical protein
MIPMHHDRLAGRGDGAGLLRASCHRARAVLIVVLPGTNRYWIIGSNRIMAIHE